MIKNIDWSKKPEIRWEKRLCPICNEPTGEYSKCHDPSTKKLFDGQFDEDSGFPRTIEVNGEILPLFSPQCAFRKSNEYIVFVNYPITVEMINVFGAIDGIERILVKSPYRMNVVIAEQFDEASIKLTVNKSYKDFITKKIKDLNDN
jgi:hypothetical protein